MTLRPRETATACAAPTPTSNEKLLPRDTATACAAPTPIKTLRPRDTATACAAPTQIATDVEAWCNRRLLHESLPMPVERELSQVEADFREGTSDSKVWGDQCNRAANEAIPTYLSVIDWKHAGVGYHHCLSVKKLRGTSSNVSRSADGANPKYRVAYTTWPLGG